VYYAAICIVLAVVIYSMRNLPHMGAKSVSQSLSILFSPRELRAFDLLTRLDQSASAHEEVHILQELGKSESNLTQKELVEYLHSPRFEVRSEALLALESIPELDTETIGALIREVKTNVYSTAYVAARILGKQRSDTAIPALVDSLDGPDYMLQSTSMVALARLGYRPAIAKIEEVIRSIENPRVRISGAYALELFGSIDSIPTLISCLKAEDRPANVSDELVLTISGILSINKEFYLLYSEFIEDNRSGVAQLTAHAHDLPLGKEPLQAWLSAVEALFAPTPDTVPLARFLLSSSKITSSILILSDALLDPKLDYPGFNYLCAYVALHIETLKDY